MNSGQPLPPSSPDYASQGMGGGYGDRREAFRRRRRGFLIAIGVFVAVAVALLVLLILLASGTIGGGWGFGRGPFLGIFGLFLILIIAFFIVRVAFVGWRISTYGGRGRNRQGGRPYGGGMHDPAMAAARVRYARGEISREQFLQYQRDFGRRPPNGGP